MAAAAAAAGAGDQRLAVAAVAAACRPARPRELAPATLGGGPVPVEAAVVAAIAVFNAAGLEQVAESDAGMAPAPIRLRAARVSVQKQTVLALELKAADQRIVGFASTAMTPTGMQSPPAKTERLGLTAVADMRALAACSAVSVGNA